MLCQLKQTKVLDFEVGEKKSHMICPHTRYCICYEEFSCINSDDYLSEDFLAMSLKIMKGKKTKECQFGGG